jgi:hypothetical protein
MANGDTAKTTNFTKLNTATSTVAEQSNGSTTRQQYNMTGTKIYEAIVIGDDQQEGDRWGAAERGVDTLTLIQRGVNKNRQVYIRHGVRSRTTGGLLVCGGGMTS